MPTLAGSPELGVEDKMVCGEDGEVRDDGAETTGTTVSLGMQPLSVRIHALGSVLMHFVHKSAVHSSHSLNTELLSFFSRFQCYDCYRAHFAYLVTAIRQPFFIVLLNCLGQSKVGSVPVLLTLDRTKLFTLVQNFFLDSKATIPL